MLRRGEPFEPVLLGNNTAEFEWRYEALINYITTEGLTGEYAGFFMGRNAITAENRARAFVTRYFRPSSIVSVTITQT